MADASKFAMLLSVGCAIAALAACGDASRTHTSRYTVSRGVFYARGQRLPLPFVLEVSDSTVAADGMILRRVHHFPVPSDSIRYRDEGPIPFGRLTRLSDSLLDAGHDRHEIVPLLATVIPRGVGLDSVRVINGETLQLFPTGIPGICRFHYSGRPSAPSASADSLTRATLESTARSCMSVLQRGGAVVVLDDGILSVGAAQVEQLEKEIELARKCPSGGCDNAHWGGTLLPAEETATFAKKAK